ncbi:hypothetical protein M405DRAFT_833005 [Rhizopogon salebrosus TDB-379]|nr:hypothetical protein M405DRAFT_833005 [Rhizopogon salebrosus TDB-379]
MEPERCDISIIDRKLVDDARPFGILYVLASLFLDESAEIFYSEDEALMDAILVIIRGQLPV